MEANLIISVILFSSAYPPEIMLVWEADAEDLIRMFLRTRGSGACSLVM